MADILRVIVTPQLSHTMRVTSVDNRLQLESPPHPPLILLDYRPLDIIIADGKIVFREGGVTS